MKMLALMFLTVLSLTQIFAQSIPDTFDVLEHESISLHEEKYIFINHSSKYWDKDSSSQKGIENLVKFSNNQNIPIVGTFEGVQAMYPNARKMFFLKLDQADLKVQSYAGQHQVKFTTAKKIFIAGGHLGECLCESIRDIVQGSGGLLENNKLDLYFVRDAIYDGVQIRDNIIKSATLPFVRRFFVPNFHCPRQNASNYPLVEIQNVTLKVFYDKSFLGQFLMTPKDWTSIYKPKRVINLKFINSSDLENYL